MELELIRFVDEISANGIVQHSDEWHKDKENTFGGSTLPTIMGVNPYSNIGAVIRQKVGLEKFGGNIKTRWGNLFEDVIKCYFELKYKTKVYGENMYYKHDDILAYSPDGLCVVRENGVEAVHLLEFKCPYSRIPTSKPPEYYIPQVKMGLELLKLPTVGRLIEAVFRPCTVKMFENGAETLNPIPRAHPKTAIIKGVSAFWYDSASFAADPSRDIAEEDVETLGGILEHLCDGSLRTAHKFTDTDPAAAAKSLYPPGSVAIGFLPWKLLKLAEHRIAPEPGFMEPYMDTIRKVDEVIKKCRECPVEERDRIVSEFVTEFAEGNV